jgi:hypothetical protein
VKIRVACVVRLEAHMERKFPLVKIVAIGSSLTLVAVFVLYRGGVIHFHRGPSATAPTTTGTASEASAAAPAINEKPPEFFRGTKSGPVVRPEDSGERIIDSTSKFGRILKPEDLTDPAKPTGDEPPPSSDGTP